MKLFHIYGDIGTLNKGKLSHKHFESQNTHETLMKTNLKAIVHNTVCDKNVVIIFLYIQ